MANLKNVIEIIIRGQDRASDDFKKVETRMGRMTDFIRQHSLLITGALAGAAVGVGAMLRSFVDTTDQIAKFSQRIGVSTEFLSEMGYVAERTGVQVNQMQIGFQRATRRIAEFVQTGAGPAADVLADLQMRGVILTRPGGGLKNIDELLPDLADYFRDLGDDTLAVRKAFQLFDSEGVSLVNILRQGSDGLATMRERARQLGLSLTSDMVDKAVAAKDATTDFTSAIKGLGNELSETLLPAATNTANALTAMITGLREGRRRASLFAKIVKWTVSPPDEPPAKPAFDAGKVDWLGLSMLGYYRGAGIPTDISDKLAASGAAAQAGWDRRRLLQSGLVGPTPAADLTQTEIPDNQRLNEVLLDRQTILDGLRLKWEEQSLAAMETEVALTAIESPINRFNEAVTSMVAPLQQSKVFAIQVFGDISAAIIKATAKMLAFRATMALFPGMAPMTSFAPRGGAYDQNYWDYRSTAVETGGDV